MKQFNILTLIIFIISIYMTCLAETQIKKLTPADVNALPSIPADHRFQYGSDMHQFADLRLPVGHGPFPVAIIIHGGCWTSTFATLQNTAALADALRDMGIATWNIEYRSIDNGGGWPGTFTDVANAANYLNRIANQYPLDLNKVIIIGHSAGGHLALWLAAQYRLSSKSELFTLQELKFKGVIVMGAPPDLAAFREHGKEVCGSDTIANLLGNSPNKRALPATPCNKLNSSIKSTLH
jgi:acetyl esterase/lipase